MIPTTLQIPNGTPTWAIAVVTALFGAVVIIWATRKLLVPALQSMGEPIQNFVVWIFGIKRLINQKGDETKAEIKAEVQADVKRTAKATAALVDVNKANPATPDICPDLEADVKAVASQPSIDEKPGEP